MNDTREAIEILSALISTPSFSREEKGTHDLLAGILEKKGIPFTSAGNNLYALNKSYDEHLPSLLLNSHHDTVKPNSGYSIDPFNPVIEDGKLFGLGSNDAGGALVSLLLTFCHFYDKPDLPVNLILGLSAEEEISGANGVELLLKKMPEVHAGIVGEPTSGDVAITEKGLLVLDCKVYGKAGHAARNEGENAIYKAIKDIEWFRTYQFPKESKSLGPVHMNVTIINAGHQHNVVPELCEYTVDVRTTDAYTLEQTLAIIKDHVNADVQPRSTRLRPSSIEPNHPLYRAVESCGFKTYGSPTLSDQALMPFPTIKLGPGDSARSHSADEFIFIDQLEKGIIDYQNLIESYFNIIAHETLG